MTRDGKERNGINDPFAYEDKRVVGYKGLQSQTERALFGTNALVDINVFVSEEAYCLIWANGRLGSSPSSVRRSCPRAHSPLHGC